LSWRCRRCWALSRWREICCRCLRSTNIDRQISTNVSSSHNYQWQCTKKIGCEAYSTLTSQEKTCVRGVNGSWCWLQIKMATKDNSCTGLFHKTASTKEARITPVQFLMRMKVELLVPLPGDNFMPCKLVNSTNHGLYTLISIFCSYHP
jgi:hypothetical protein